MTSGPESPPRQHSSLQSTARLASVLAISIGALVLMGWLFRIEILKSILPIWISMKANTALSLILAGLALRLYQRAPGVRALERVAQGCALLVAVIGLLTLGEYLFGLDLGIDQLIFREPVGTIRTSLPGRMALPTAFNFALLGWALYFYPRQRNGWLVQIPVISVGWIALLGVAGYLYDVEDLQRIGPTFIALHTTLAFLILAAGILLSEPDSGLMGWVTRADAGGLMLRQLLPVTVIVPIGVGGVVLAGVRLGVYPVETGWAVFALATVLTLAVFIGRNAVHLRQMDQALRGSEQRLMESNAVLEQRVRERTAELAASNDQLQRLIAQTLRQSQELALLDEVRTAISRELDLSVILRTVVEAIAHTFEYQLVSLYLLEGDRLILQHQVGYEKTLPQIPLGEGVTSQAILAGQPVLLEDIHEDPAFLGAIDGIVSEIAVPLFHREQVAGVLNVESTQGMKLTGNDLNLLIALGKSINIAFQRAKLYQAEREQRVLAEALADTAAALTSTPHLHEVFDRILKNAGRVVPHQNANIMLLEEGVAKVVGGLGYTEPALKVVLTIRLRVAETPNLRWMSETGQPLVIPDTKTHEDWLDLPETRWIRSYAGAPIQVRGKTVGFINLNAGVPGYFKDDHAQRLQAFAHQAAVAVENAELYARTQQLAITDELTGVYNRRGLFELGRREVERAMRFSHTLSALILDIDHFKAVNDTYGHTAGDQILQTLAGRCLANIREIDILGRYGGEEFVILLPESTLLNSCKVAERLRKLVADEPFPTRYGSIGITISLGVASVSEREEDLVALIERADQAIYLAKRSGRNRVASI